MNTIHELKVAIRVKLDGYKKDIAEAKAATKKLREAVAGETQKTKAAASGMLQNTTKETSNGVSKITQAVSQGTKRIRSLVASVFVFSILNAGLKGLKEQISSCLKTNREFSNSLNTVKTNLQVSFSSIYTAVLPAINKLMNALAGLTTAAAVLISGLFGNTYADSLKTAQGLKTATAAMTEYNGAASKGQTFSFDEVHNVSDPSGGNSDMDLDNASTSLAETTGLISSLQKKLAGLFAPLKTAWDSNGGSVIAAAKTGFHEITLLCRDIGSSFDTVWGNGTGVEVGNNVLYVLKNIFKTIGNVGAGWRQAWNNGDAGAKIVQGLFDILLDLAGAISRISELTATWSSNVNFEPILTSFQGLLAAIEPLTSTACDGLVWMWENVLLPFEQWRGEAFIPAFFDMVSAALSTVNSVLGTFRPFGQWLWENFLTPIASWTGGVIVGVLETIANALNVIGDWVASHRDILETMAIVVGSIATAIGLVNTAIGIWNVVGAIASGVTGALATAVTILTSPVTLVIAVIAALIAIGVLLYKNWDTIKAKANQIWTAIKEKITTVVTNIKTGISNMLNSVKTAWNNVWNGCKTTVVNIFTSIWDKIKSVINSILSGIEGMANGVVGGINKVIEAMNGLSFEIPDWVPLMGGKTFGFNITPLATVQLPRLAKGGIVSSATTLIAGEAGREAIVPLENNTGWLDNVAHRIAEYINGRIGDAMEGDDSELALSIPITLELDGDILLKKLIKVRKKKGYQIVEEDV